MEFGSTLLHYSVEGRLGQGGMGTVYRARDTKLDRTVAIKVLEISDRDAMQHLLHEARAASALNHPNSVTIHSVEQQGDTAFIVMWAMPATTVVKTTGAISIFTSLMKPSPSGFIAAARSGASAPKMTPIAIAIKTWK